MGNFKDWFAKKLIVGRFPKFEIIEADMTDIDIIINVSAE